jgi:hypothetical protein
MTDDTPEPTPTQRLAGRLGIAADRLDDMEQYGPAAACRTAAWLLGLEKIGSLNHALVFARVRLRDADAPGLADDIESAQDELRGRCRPVGFQPGPHPSRVDPARPEVRDPSGYLAAHPGVLAAIDRWLNDPAPKLPGIIIEAAMREDAGREPMLWLRLGGRMPDGRAWEHTRSMLGWEWQPIRDGRGDGLMFRTLEELHRAAIRTLRDARNAPADDPEPPPDRHEDRMTWLARHGRIGPR